MHRVREAQKRGKGQADRPLWPWSRMSVWRQVRAVMIAAGIPDGSHRCPKGLRHGYGVHAISSGVPLNMLCKWMGHASMEVTAIYANALGAEEQGIASLMGILAAAGRARRERSRLMANDPVPAGPAGTAPVSASCYGCRSLHGPVRRRTDPARPFGPGLADLVADLISASWALSRAMQRGQHIRNPGAALTRFVALALFIVKMAACSAHNEN